jgi:hypothetical protein
MIDHAIIVEFSDLERGVEETMTVAFAAENDVEYECEVQAMRLGTRYSAMPRQRGRRRWEIREPGELLVVIRAERLLEDHPDGGRTGAAGN